MTVGILHLIVVESPLKVCARTRGGLATESRTNAELLTNRWCTTVTFACGKNKVSADILLFVVFYYLCRLKNKIMANHKATKKDVRQAAKRRDRNRYYGKTTRNAIRDLKVVTDQSAFADKLPSVASMIDKLAKRGIIHKNKAANLKSKLARRTATLGATATA
jgi:small subunit ribosomal protein S20